MGQSLRIDDDQLRSLVPEYETIGDLAHQALARLKASIEREGKCWGEDDPGRSFEETYLADAEKAVESLEKTVQSLREEGKVVAGIADDFHDNDQDGGRLIRDAADQRTGLRSVSPTDQGLNGSGYPDFPISSPEPTPAPAGSDPSAEAASNPSDTTPYPFDTDPHPFDTNPSGTAGGPNGSPDSSQPSGTPQTPTAPGNAEPAAPTPDDTADNPTGGNPNNLAPAPGSTALPAARDTARPAAPRPNITAASGDGPSTDRKQANTPWSKTAPENNTPPRVSAPNNQGSSPGMPRMPDSPARNFAPSPSARKSKSRVIEPKSVSPHPWVINGTGDDNNAGIARELSDRHDLEVVGFDTPGVDEHTVREIAAAIDDVLSGHPYLDVRQIAVADCGEEVARLEWDWVAGSAGPEAFTRRITLNTLVARDPGKFAEYVRAATLSGALAPGSDRRPVYSTIVRELGHALDVAGGFGARQTAEKVLIADYTRTHGAEHEDAAVSGDRQWRGQLSSYGFYEGRFDPGMALADAFAEVQLNGPGARQPAKVLHQLLIDTARRHSGARS